MWSAKLRGVDGEKIFDSFVKKSFVASRPGFFSEEATFAPKK